MLAEATTNARKTTTFVTIVTEAASCCVAMAARILSISPALTRPWTRQTPQREIGFARNARCQSL